jgi:hypothetical protein
MANAKQAIEVMDRIRVDLTTVLSNRRFGQFHRERRDCRHHVRHATEHHAAPNLDMIVNV